MRRDILDAIASSVEGALDAHGMRINAISYQNLLVHIAIALIRIESGCFTLVDPTVYALVENQGELAAARAVAAGIHDRLGVQLPDGEVAYIAVHLASKRTVVDAIKGRESENGLVITDEIWSIVDEMVASVCTHFHFDFDGDIELRMNLARHLVPLQMRLLNKMNLKNPLLGDIAMHYPLAWSMAADACSVLRGRFDTCPSNDEVGYIAMAFALALERQRGEVPGKRLLVVCASGAGSARLLKFRCQKEFGPYIESIETCDVMHVADVDFSHIDYVFTTVPIRCRVPVPVREVPFFLDGAEVDDIRDSLCFGDGAGALAAHFHPYLFFPHVALSSKAEVLHMLCSAACDVHEGCEGLESLVLEREAAAATSFGNMVAMPHPLEPVSDETFVAVALLDQPLAWDEIGAHVQVVFLVSFSKEGGRALDAFVGALAEIISDETAISRLIEHRDWETLMGLFGPKSLDEAPSKVNR